MVPSLDVDTTRAKQALLGIEIATVVGWREGIAWIEAWRRVGDWIVVDRAAHAAVCRSLGPDSWRVLWYDSIEPGDVLALLAELHSRSETRRILVVLRLIDGVALRSPEIVALQRRCWIYDATLLAVLEDC